MPMMSIVDGQSLHAPSEWALSSRCVRKSHLKVMDDIERRFPASRVRDQCCVCQGKPERVNRACLSY
jgi:hypothetical protein